MPYISDAQRREELRLHPATFQNVGEFNFVISDLCAVALRKWGLRYDTVNALVGVLECAKQEFYRRVAVPYEDKKRKENGDVY